MVCRSATPVVDSLSDSLLSAVGDSMVVEVSDLEDIAIMVNHIVDDPDQTAGTVATLALDPITANITTVIRAVAPGADYNVLTLAFVADGSGAGSLVRTGNAYVFHFQAGTTTSADFVSAVGALTDQDAMIEVQSAGALVTLAAPGDVFAATNLSGGTDGEGHFAIVLESSVDTINYAPLATVTHSDFPDGSGSAKEVALRDSNGMPKRAARVRARVTELQDSSSFSVTAVGSSTR